MKMKHIIILIFSTGLFTACGNNSKNYPTEINNQTLEETGITLNDLLTFTKVSDDLRNETMNSNSIYKEGYALLSKSNKGAIKVGHHPLSNLLSPDTIEINLVIDEILNDVNPDAALINTVLKTINSGIQIEFIGPDRSRNLSVIVTNGKINTNTVTEALNSKHEWNVFLFKDSQFFNTANAVALKAKNGDNDIQNFILGNGYLLESPYLFAHELFHGLGLTHYNGMYSDCDTATGSKVSNVMNESNIGCSRRLSARQIMMMNGQMYFDKLENEMIFPEEGKCECHYSGLDTQIELYLNSFDRNIDDTPLVGDDEELLEYVAQLKENILPSDKKSQVKKNYALEAKELKIFGADTINYVNDRVEVLERLRLYNLTRWIKENAEMKGIEVDSNIWEMDFNNVGQLFADYVVRTSENFCKTKCEDNFCPLMIGDNYNICETCKETRIESFQRGTTRTPYQSLNRLFKDFPTLWSNVMDDKSDESNGGGTIGDGDVQTGGTNQDDPGEPDKDLEEPQDDKNPNNPKDTRGKKGN